MTLFAAPDLPYFSFSAFIIRRPHPPSLFFLSACIIRRSHSLFVIFGIPVSAATSTALRFDAFAVTTLPTRHDNIRRFTFVIRYIRHSSPPHLQLFGSTLSPSLLSSARQNLLRHLFPHSLLFSLYCPTLLVGKTHSPYPYPLALAVPVSLRTLLETSPPSPTLSASSARLSTPTSWFDNFSPFSFYIVRSWHHRLRAQPTQVAPTLPITQSRSWYNVCYHWEQARQLRLQILRHLDVSTCHLGYTTGRSIYPSATSSPDCQENLTRDGYRLLSTPILQSGSWYNMCYHCSRPHQSRPKITPLLPLLVTITVSDTAPLAFTSLLSPRLSCYLPRILSSCLPRLTIYAHSSLSSHRAIAVHRLGAQLPRSAIPPQISRPLDCVTFTATPTTTQTRPHPRYFHGPAIFH